MDEDRSLVYCVGAKRVLLKTLTMVSPVNNLVLYSFIRKVSF